MSSTASELISRVGLAALLLLDTVYQSTIRPCLSRHTPASPSLSAQEGELDNLLTEPAGGWDDDTETISIAPHSIRYGKEGLLATRQRSASTVAKVSTAGNGDQDARVLGEVDLGALQWHGKDNWEPGRTVEDLEREEAELAKMDPPAPAVEFGDFESGLSPPKTPNDNNV